MAQHANLAERIAYGRPLDPATEDTMTTLVPRATTALIGRILLAAIFVLSGFAKLADTEGTIGHMTAAGIPAPEILVYFAAAAEILGGLSILTGFLTRIGAIGLIIFLIPTTLVFHAFWKATGTEVVMQMANFMKNIGLMGGLLLLVAYGAGRYSIDANLRRPLPA